VVFGDTGLPLEKGSSNEWKWRSGRADRNSYMVSVGDLIGQTFSAQAKGNGR
jgi:hypothetical protein